MIILSIFSSRVFLRTRLIKLNGGKAKPYSLSQGSRNASVAILPGSDFYAMYRGSWWYSLDANRSRVGCPMCVTISWKTEASLNLVSLALVIFYCLILNFPPTKEVPVLTDCLILSLPGINRPGLVIVFVVVVNILAVDELAELLGHDIYQFC